MKKTIKELEDNRLLLCLKKEVYTTEAIYASTYKFTKKCTIFIDPLDDQTLGIYFELKLASSNEELRNSC